MGFRRVAGVDATEWWDFTPGQPVMTVEGFPGRVTAVNDQSPDISYEVTLDAGMGGGTYGAGELRPLSTTTAVERTAADDYPELGDILVRRPPPENADIRVGASLVEAAFFEDMVDYKADTRPLTGPGTTPIRTLIPSIAGMVPYADLPFMDQVHALQGTSNSTPTKAFLQARESLFDTFPKKVIPVSQVVVTQDNVNDAQVSKLMALPHGALRGGLYFVKYHGKYYLLNGHHRMVGFVLNGASNVDGHVLDLDAAQAKAGSRTAAYPPSYWPNNHPPGWNSLYGDYECPYCDRTVLAQQVVDNDGLCPWCMDMGRQTVVDTVENAQEYIDNGTAVTAARSAAFGPGADKSANPVSSCANCWTPIQQNILGGDWFHTTQTSCPQAVPTVAEVKVTAVDDGRMTERLFNNVEGHGLQRSTDNTAYCICGAVFIGPSHMALLGDHLTEMGADTEPLEIAASLLATAAFVDEVTAMDGLDTIHGNGKGRSKMLMFLRYMGYEEGTGEAQDLIRRWAESRGIPVPGASPDLAVAAASGGSVRIEGDKAIVTSLVPTLDGSFVAPGSYDLVDVTQDNYGGAIHLVYNGQTVVIDADRYGYWAEPDDAGQWTAAKKCERCNGTGRVFGGKMSRTCPECNGSKTASWVVVDGDGFIHFGPVANRWAADDALKEVRQDPKLAEATLYVQRAPEADNPVQWSMASTAEVYSWQDEPDPSNPYAGGTGEFACYYCYHGLAHRECGPGPAAVEEKTAGVMDWVVDKMPGEYTPGTAPSFDWCRFRKDQRCMYPKELDAVGTKQAGYPVWVPEDRGYCPRHDWDDQKACPVGEAGPHSGEPGAQVECTAPWSQGGQRGGVRVLSIRSYASDRLTDFTNGPDDAPDPDEKPGLIRRVIERVKEDAKAFGDLALDANDAFEAFASQRTAAFEFTATWRDIQAKAKRIRSEGGVRIRAITATTVTGDVKGDNAVYQTTLMMAPGTRQVAMWECGCPWSTYSWGRSGRWKRYEGRMCAHALALSYEATSRGFGGKTMTEDAKAPAWDRNPRVPGERTMPDKWRVARMQMRDLSKDATPEEVAALLMEQAAVRDPKITRDIREVATKTDGKPIGLQFRRKGEGSMLRKLKEKYFPKGLRGVDAFNAVGDALRYTISYPEVDWGNDVQTALWALEDRGYTVLTADNYWQKGDPYSGYNLNLMDREGFIFELQFHTDRSFDLKDRKLHKMYEEFRRADTPLPRRQELFDTMSKYWDDLPIPANGLEFPKLKMHERPTAKLRRLNFICTDADLAAAPIEHLASFDVRYNNGIVEVVEVLPGGMVELESGIVVPDEKLIYPTYDPVKGLNFTGAYEASACPSCGSSDIKQRGQVGGGGTRYACRACSHSWVEDANTQKAAATTPVPRFYIPWQEHKADEFGPGFWSVQLGGDYRMRDGYPPEPAEFMDAMVHELGDGASDTGGGWEWEASARSQWGDQRTQGWTPCANAEDGKRLAAQWLREQFASFWADFNTTASLAPEAELHDEPEPALPTTDGADDEGDGSDKAPPPPLGLAHGPGDGIEDDMLVGHRASVNDGSRAWLMGGASSGGSQDSKEIAAMAARFLKEGAKAFSPAEQRMLIEEGDGSVTAANLDRLDIVGTHYEQIEASLDDDLLS